MSKRVGIAALKAQLSKHLRSVRRGETITVLDHGTPVAELVPPREARSALRIRPATGLLSDVELPARPKRPVDLERHLSDERADRK